MAFQAVCYNMEEIGRSCNIGNRHIKFGTTLKETFQSGT